MKVREILTAYRLLADFYRIDINKASTWGAGVDEIHSLQMQLDKFNALVRFYENLMINRY